MSAAQVDLLYLTIEEEGEGARPDEGSHDNHGVGAGLSLGGVIVAVLGSVTAKAHTPSWLFEFHASRDFRIVRYLFEKWLVGVGVLEGKHRRFSIELLAIREVAGVLRWNVIGTTVIEDVGARVNPHRSTFHLVGGRHFEGIVLLALISNNSETSVLIFGLLELRDAKGSK